jgi:hypothetical protein
MRANARLRGSTNAGSPKEGAMRSNKTLVIRNGTLIDGSGKDAARNETIVIEGNRIKSVGPLPPDVAE